MKLVVKLVMLPNAVPKEECAPSEIPLMGLVNVALLAHQVMSALSLYICIYIATYIVNKCILIANIMCLLFLEIYGDPHFIVPLLSKEVLCYSIQGYPGLAFNLIYNKNFIINAQFVDSMGDTTEATWIGKLAVIPQNATSSNPVIFDSVNHQVIVVGQGSLSASMIKEIIFNENGVKFTQAVERQSGNPTVQVTYSKQQADFDVTFHTNHLNVNWDFKYDDAFELPAMHGIIGKLRMCELIV